MKYEYLLNLGDGILGVCCFPVNFTSECLCPFEIEGEG